MRRIDDPITLRDYLSRLSHGTNLTVAQARLLLASRGIRVHQRVVEAALKLPAADPEDSPPPPAAGGRRAGRHARLRKASPAPQPKPMPRPRLKPLDDLPLTPREREIMERLRGGR